VTIDVAPLPARRRTAVGAAVAASIPVDEPVAAPEPMAPSPEPEAAEAPVPTAARRTAMAELTAIASAADDFTYRRR
jgi:hypothetical protein